jgi:hypothetical protein
LPGLSHVRRAGPSGLAATALYLAITLIFTWPLALGLTRDIPWDLGDSLLNAWILAWNADHFLRFLTGHFSALSGFWNANIFHPEPLTLAYSEHLIGQTLQILPVYALTGNIILSYNLLFLSTFVLSGLGTYLFVRQVTGSVHAGFVAGLIYAFAPYRVPQFAHLQVLSSQWMPFALYGLRRYFDAVTHERQVVSGFSRTVDGFGRTMIPLVGAAAALVAQNLSNGYFMLFFSPIAAAYVIFELVTRRLWRDVRLMAALATTATIVVLVTLPVFLPYLQLRRLGFPPRPIAEIVTYSADVFSYWTAPPESHVWGEIMRAFPKPEGDLFQTFTALALASIGVIAAVRSSWQKSRDTATAIGRLNPIAYFLLGVCALYALLLILVFSGVRFETVGPLPISVRRIGRPLIVLALAVVLLFGVSPRMRSFSRAWLGSLSAFAVLLACLAFFLSLGPEIRSNGRLIGETGLYSFLYSNVPGFDGLRVPARYGMLGILFLAVAGGYGVAEVERRFARGWAIAVVLGILVVGESFAAPIIVNGTSAEGGYAPPPPRVYTGDMVPAVYRFLKELPSPDTVVVEFPFGEWGYEVRYMFYSTNHWHPLLNGYSGTFPLSYSLRGVLLRHPLDSPELAWKSLMEDGATHAIVHGGLFLDDEGDAIGKWLVERGARQIATFDGDKVFALR